MRLVHAELLKIWTAPRTTLGLVLALIAIVALGTAATASSGDDSPTASETAVLDVLEIASTAAFFTLLLGILIVTWEYRHGTVTPTFLITPRRERVLLSKLVVAATVAVALTLLAIVIGLALAPIWVDVDLGRGQWELIGRLIYGAVAWAVLGVGLGAILQSQVGGIVLAFVWFLIAEQIIGAGLDELIEVSDYFPGSALERLFSTDTGSPGEFGGDDRAYGLWAAAGLVAAYAAAAAILGAVAAERRDVS